MGKRIDCGKFTTPAGHIKEGECPFMGMCREFKEETGVDPDHIKLVRATYLKDKKIFLYLFKVVLPKEFEFDASKDPDKECLSWNFVDLIDVIEQLHVPVKDNIAVQYWINEDN
jgi:8-oxo-dGTP pyrophosphatase MutT (NUDIX family)